jgi:small subunit ribosomal protein S17e
MLTQDFDTNKRIIDEIAIVPTKRLRNKIAGFVTHLMKRIQKGTVRGISLRLQEEERERRFDFVPKVSFVDEEIKKNIQIDTDTFDMLEEIGFVKLQNVVKAKENFQKQDMNKRKPRRDKKEKETVKDLNAE